MVRKNIKPLVDQQSTQKFKILFTAYKLNREMSIQELAVESWKMYPDDFGMKSYDLPSVDRVYSKVQGANRLIKNGLLDQLDNGNLRISKKGFLFVCRSSLTLEAMDMVKNNARENETQRSDRLEKAEQESTKDAVLARRDGDRRVESADQKRRPEAECSGDSPRQMRDNTNVLGERIEAGRVVGGDGSGGRTVESENSNDRRNRDGRRRDMDSNEGERPDDGIRADGDRDTTNDLDDKTSITKPRQVLVPCYYCSAGTAPAYVDEEDRPMCGGCHRDLGKGRKARKRRKGAESGEWPIVKLPRKAGVVMSADSNAPADMLLIVPQVATDTIAPITVKVSKPRGKFAPRSMDTDTNVIRIPMRYVVRKFEGHRSGGHSIECLNASGIGCIVMCPLRMTWEADGRPEK